MDNLARRQITANDGPSGAGAERPLMGRLSCGGAGFF